MRAPGAVTLILLLFILPLPAAAGAFTLSLPAESWVKIGSPSRLAFRVTNTSESEELSRLTLRFPSDYQVKDGSAPPGWSVERAHGGSAGASSEISFRTTDEAKCTGAIPPGRSRVFGVEVIAPASRAVTPDSLLSAQAEQSCRGVALDPPATLPSWDRLGVEVALAAGPPIVGLGGDVRVTMTVTNLSSVVLTDISALLRATGTGSVSGVTGPNPGNLSLAPGASASMSWRARAAAAGTVSFSGQAVGHRVASPSVRSDILFVGDLDVSLSVTPEQVVSGRDVEARMTVRNRGPVRLTNVTPSPLTFDGTAAASTPSGPSPASQPVLEPGEATTFTWAAMLRGKAGDVYAFSGWASAEWGAILSANATSNRGTLTREEVAGGRRPGEGSFMVGGGGLGSDVGSADGGTAAAAVTGGGTAAAAVPSASLQFVAVNHDGRSTGGAEFSSALVRDLRILVGWQNLSGTHSQRVELFSPDGSLYQRLSAQFAGTPVETRLPVGGTWITEHSLFGAWRVDVFLDREQMPISSRVFVLTP